MPLEVIATFKEFVEHCEPQETRSFRDITASMQILNANLRDLQDPKGIRASLSLQAFILRSADLHARADMLFGYARFEHDEADRMPTRHDVEKALIFFGFNREDDDVAGLYARTATHCPG